MSLSAGEYALITKRARPKYTRRENHDLNRGDGNGGPLSMRFPKKSIGESAWRTRLKSQKKSAAGRNRRNGAA